MSNFSVINCLFCNRNMVVAAFVSEQVQTEAEKPWWISAIGVMEQIPVKDLD